MGHLDCCLRRGEKKALPTGHTIVIPFWMYEHFIHHDGLLWALLFVLIVIAEDYPECVKAKQRQGSSAFRSRLHANVP